MKLLETRIEEALALMAAIEGQLKPGERSQTFLARTARRRLLTDASGDGQLHVEDGKLGGFICLRKVGHELYLNAPELACTAVADLLDVGRNLIHLGGTGQGLERELLHTGLNGTVGWENVGWENSARQLDPPSLRAAPAIAAEAISGELRGDQSIQSVQVSEILTESTVSGSGESPHWSRCYGVEAKAVVRAGPTTTSLSRYGTSVTGLDLPGLGRELAITTVGMGPARRQFTGSDVIFTPSAAAQLLYHVVTSLLITPIVNGIPLCTSIVDDGPAVQGYCARAYDCEGTPTGPMELVGRDGVQRPVATRHQAVPAGCPGAKHLTGHARWDPLRTHPQLSATNVSLAPTVGDGWRPDADCCVVDVRSLGVEEHRSGGRLALRLQSVRMEAGEPCEAFLPILVAGEAPDFLASVVAVGPTVSFFPGPVSVAGSYLAMDLTGVMPKKRDLDGG